MPASDNVQALQSFLGLANFYQGFIKNMLNLRGPLNELLKKDKPSLWTPECQESFEKIKKTSECQESFEKIKKTSECLESFEKIKKTSECQESFEKIKKTSECQESFEKIKKTLTLDLSLTHYDPTLDIIVASGASSYGIGACILHKTARWFAKSCGTCF